MTEGTKIALGLVVASVVGAYMLAEKINQNVVEPRYDIIAVDGLLTHLDRHTGNFRVCHKAVDPDTRRWTYSCGPEVSVCSSSSESAREALDCLLAE